MEAERKKILRAVNVYKRFNGVTALDGVSLEIHEGEFVSIVGASGSGKSTLLSILGGVEKADEGEVFLGEEELGKKSEKELARLRRTRIGYVFQFFNLAPYLTAEENILLPLLLDGKREKEGRERLVELARYLGVESLLNRLPRKLSGGEQQRVAIARGLIFSPEVILLDEPTGNLDSRNSREIMELLTKINRERGATVVQVTHSEENAAYADRILTMKDGKISSVRQLSPRSISSKPERETIEERNDRPIDTPQTELGSEPLAEEGGAGE